MTWAMRRRSAMTGGRSGSMSIRMLSLPPPLRNEFLARSTRAAAADGSGDTDSVPLSMRAMSSRSVMRSLIRGNSRLPLEYLTLDPGSSDPSRAASSR